MEGITITCVFPEEVAGYDYKGYCENLIEKVKIIQTTEEREWNLELIIYEKPPTTLKTGYISTVVVGEEERIVFLHDSNNEKCPIITDTKEYKFHVVLSILRILIEQNNVFLETKIFQQ